MMGDVVASRRIKNRGAFQRKLDKICANVNLNFAEYIYADFNILKGLDEIGGVLMNIKNVYKIMNTFLEQCYPDSIRFVLVYDYIDTALESHEVSRMDGPAFHKSSDMLKDLKGSRLILTNFSAKPVGQTLSKEVLDTGFIIGKCENILILTFMFLDAYTALALIFAAKTIVRREDMSKNSLFFPQHIIFIEEYHHGKYASLHSSNNLFY